MTESGTSKTIIPKETVKDRLRKTTAAGLFAILAVLLQLFLMRFGLGLRCPFRLLTGLKCPGCGVSHLALHFLTGHPVKAFYDNPVVFCELPVLAYMIGRQTYRYIKTGSRRETKIERALLVICLIALCIFGIVRNLP